MRPRYLDIGQDLFCLFMERDAFDVIKQYRVVMNGHACGLIKDLLVGIKNTILLRDTAGNPERT